jgi:hypothetical protein
MALLGKVYNFLPEARLVLARMSGKFGGIACVGNEP